MKTIFNWTVGSFFRSIGRIVAYVFIGGLIAYILNRSGVDWGRFLGIEKVNAETWSQFNIGDIYDNQNNWGNPSIGGGVYRERLLQTYTNYNEGNGVSLVNPIFGTDINYVIVTGYINDLNGDSQTYDCFQVGSTNSCEQWYNSSGDKLLFKLWLGGWANACKIDIDDIPTDSSDTVFWTATCPYDKNLINTMYYKFNYSPGQNALNYVKLGINKFVYLVKDSQQGTTNAINQQTQQQQQQYNDTNATSQSNQASSYFQNQQDETPSALTSAITSPLRIIDNAIQGTHNPLCFTLNSKQTCIPSGDLIWGGTGSNNFHHWFDSGQFNPKVTFVNFFNIVVGGFLCYKMLISMLRIFNNAIDPTYAGIEVMKL